MDLKTLMDFEWSAMAPEFTIVITATLLSLIDMFMAKDKNRNSLAWLGLFGILLAFVFTFTQLNQEPVSILYDTYRLDSFSKAFKLLFLAGAALIFLMSMSDTKKEITHRGEFYYLMLAALLGAMMMASSADLITLFVGLELLSLSSYILAGIRKNNQQSNEAAMKYVINGGMSTAITLFGLSYIYGLTGSTNLFEISNVIGQISGGNLQLLLCIAFIMLFVGLSFKIAAAPFHMWSPDVYQGAAMPVTAFLSVVSKTAGFVIIIRIFDIAFIQSIINVDGKETLLVTYMHQFIAVLAAVTMVIGNTIALRQKNVKRMLAYSSIAHAGYVLVPFVAFSAFMFEGVWFYLMAYLFMNIGAFAILQSISASEGTEDISAFSGLYKRSPVTAVLMSIFLLSLAGIPGTAGFIGKFNIFVGALATQPAHYVLAGIMMATTVISYYYYFGIMKQMFFGVQHSNAKVPIPSIVMVVIIICAVGTLAFGIAPGIALDFFYENFNMNEFFGKLVG